MFSYGKALRGEGDSALLADGQVMSSPQEYPHLSSIFDLAP